MHQAYLFAGMTATPIVLNNQSKKPPLSTYFAYFGISRREIFFGERKMNKNDKKHSSYDPDENLILFGGLTSVSTPKNHPPVEKGLFMELRAAEKYLLRLKFLQNSYRNGIHSIMS